jgi:hypothetical protein
MNIDFSLKRFFRFFLNNYRLNNKKDLLFLGGMFVFAGIYFALFRLVKEPIDLIGTIFILLVSFLIIQGVYTCMFFGEFSSKKRTMQLLTLPVSNAEAFWSKFLSCFVVFPLIFILFSILVLQISIEYNEWYMTNIAGQFLPDFLPMREIREIWDNRSHFDSGGLASLFYLVPFFISISFLWGAMTFKKYAFIKSLIFWFLFIISLWPLTIFIYFLISGHFTPLCIPFLIIREEGFGSSGIDVPFIFLYPNLFKYAISFVSLFLIVISRVKFNEKTI